MDFGTTNFVHINFRWSSRTHQVRRLPGSLSLPLSYLRGHCIAYTFLRALGVVLFWSEVKLKVDLADLTDPGLATLHPFFLKLVPPGASLFPSCKHKRNTARLGGVNVGKLYCWHAF